MSVGSAQLEVEVEPRPASRSPLRLAWPRFRRDRAALIALAVVVLLLLVAILASPVTGAVGASGPDVRNASALSSFDTPTGPSHHALWPWIVLFAGAALAVLMAHFPGAVVRRRGPLAVFGVTLLAAIVLAIVFWPSDPHLFGVDPAGRDLFSRIVYGARASLLAPLAAAGLAVLIGTAVGLVAGAVGGVVETVVCAVLGALTPIPLLLLTVGVAASCTLGGGCLGGLISPGVPVLIGALALAVWAPVARTVRAEAAALRERPSFIATRSLGVGRLRAIAVELVPDLRGPVLATAVRLVPQCVLLDAALCFLGVGTRGATPSWGAMLRDATTIYSSAWWYMLFPGAALLITVLAMNVLADGAGTALAGPRDA
jgi:peptide/nickel transport system permease protein